VQIGHTTAPEPGKVAMARDIEGIPFGRGERRASTWRRWRIALGWFHGIGSTASITDE
jgi:hypothetical protein